MAMPNEMTDAEILAALRAGGAAREMAWEFMYKKWRGIWLRKILDAGGTSDQAHEAHDKVAMAFEKTVTAPGFQLHSAKLSTYLVKGIFLRWIGRPMPTPPDEFEDRHVQSFAESVDAAVIREECKKLLDVVIDDMVGGRCKKILTLWAERYTMDEIAVAMGFKGGPEVAKKEKYKCLQNLIKHLEKQPKIRASLEDCLQWTINKYKKR